MSTQSKSVQFRNAADVVAAYLSRDVATFAIFCNRQLLFKYEGDSVEEGEQNLTEMLELLERNQSAAIYMLAVYEETSGKINDKTPYHGSFNFRFQDLQDNFKGGNMHALQSQVNALTVQVQKLTEENAGDEEEEDDYGLGKVGRILNHPAIQPLLPGIGQKLVDFIMPENNPGHTARIAGIEVTTDPLNEKKINEALQILNREVSDLGDVLLKMAAFAQKKPNQFKFYISALKGMKL